MREVRSRVAVLVEDGYQELELWYPYYRLIEAGFQPVLVGPEVRSYKGKHGYEASAMISVSEAESYSFQGLIVPGGNAHDHLRRYPAIVEMVKSIFDQGKLLASICHGGSLLISANAVKGRKVTSLFSMEVDLINAGARYLDREVVVDDNLITSCRPDDLPAFMREVLVFLRAHRSKLD
ncbi:MAG: type 1 glutamine amidotransferase [Methanomassiliicoccales archaeon]|nr:type 1 glutamine amidotransferase [Methanomassiliicoccales archaeon]